MTPTCSRVSGTLSEEGALQDGRTEREKRMFQGGGRLGIPHTGGVDRKGCPPGTELLPGRRAPEEAAAGTSERATASAQILSVCLSTTNKVETYSHSSHSDIYRILVQEGKRGVTSSSLQPTSQRHLCSLHGRTIPRTEQATWAALRTRKCSLPREGNLSHALQLYHLVLVPAFLHSTHGAL